MPASAWWNSSDGSGIVISLEWPIAIRLVGWGKQIYGTSNADNPEQSRRFIDMAREVEVDETPGSMERAFEKVIGQTSSHLSFSFGIQPRVDRISDHDRRYLRWSAIVTMM